MNVQEQGNPSAVFADAFQALFEDRVIAYHPAIAHATGSVTAAVLLSQLAYWTPRAQDPDGWIYKTQDELTEETGLTRREQETARRVLVSAGVLEERRQGLPARLYYRIEMPKVADMIARSRQTRMAFSAKQARRFPPDLPGVFRQTFNTEITTEITAESTGTDFETVGLARGARTDLVVGSAPAPAPPTTKHRNAGGHVTPSRDRSQLGDEEYSAPRDPSRPARPARTRAQKAAGAPFLVAEHIQAQPKAQAVSRPAESPTGASTAAPTAAPVNGAAPQIQVLREWRDQGGGRLNAAQCRAGGDLLEAWRTAGREGEFWALVAEACRKGWRWSGFLNAAEERLTQAPGLPSNRDAARRPVVAATNVDPRTADPRTLPRAEYNRTDYVQIDDLLVVLEDQQIVAVNAAAEGLSIEGFLQVMRENLQDRVRAIVAAGGKALPTWGALTDWAREQGFPVW